MKIMILAMMALFVDGCGQDRVVKEYVPVPTGGTGSTGTGGTGGQPSYQETQALLNNYCQACHSTAQFMQSERALRASAVKDRVRSGNMPPSNAGKQLPNDERKKILNFF